MDIVEITGKVITIIPMLIAVASAICAITPTPKDDAYLGKAKSWLAKFYRVIEVLALNIGKAKQ